MTPHEAGRIGLWSMAGLRAAEAGLLSTALALMVKHDGPISREELREWAHPSDRAAFPRRLRSLVRKGKLQVSDDGLLTANPMVIEAFAIVMLGAPFDDAP